MKIIQVLLFTLMIFPACIGPKTSAIVGGEYDKEKNQTNYFVLPFGSTSIPGKWTKTRYNETSKQQFFSNADSISIAISFTPVENYEFNTNNSKKGFEFINAFYKWEAEYFVNTHKLEKEEIELNKAENYIIWRVSGIFNNSSIDTYFLFGEKNGFANNFSVTITDKWTREEKIKILKEMYLGK